MSGSECGPPLMQFVVSRSEESAVSAGAGYFQGDEVGFSGCFDGDALAIQERIVLWCDHEYREVELVEVVVC